MSMHVTTGLPYVFTKNLAKIDYRHFRQSSSSIMYNDNLVAELKPCLRRTFLKHRNSKSLYRFLKENTKTEVKHDRGFLFESAQMFAEAKLKYARNLKFHVIPTINHWLLSY